MEEVVTLIEKPNEETAETPNTINFDTMCSDSINALLKTIKVNEYAKAAEIVDLIKTRSIIIGDIDENTGTTIDNYIRFWNNYDKELNIPVDKRIPIKICVDSNGGDLMSTLTAINAIENSITPVWTINLGRAFSGGFLIMLAGHKRFAYKYSTFLFHEGSTGGVSGDANKFQNYADHYKALRTLMKQIVLEKTKLTEEEYLEKQKDDWWFMVPEALEKGIIDEIATKDWYC